MGIVFHTIQEKNMLVYYAWAMLGVGTSIFLLSAQYTDKSGSITFSKSELRSFDAQIRMAEGLYQKTKGILNDMSTARTDPLSVAFRLKTFFNYFIKNTKGDMGKVRDMQQQFRLYYNNMLQGEIDAKRLQGKEKYIKAQKEGLRFIDRNKTALYFAIASHITLANCKNTLLRKMNQIQSIGHFVRTSNGYRVTAPDRYVAVDRIAGAVKLVID